MGTSIAVIDKELGARLSIFKELLPPQVRPERLARTVVMSCEKLPALLNCDLPSILSAATTAAVLGLECDGVTGQAYILPFKGRAQLIIGYKGYSTLGARAGVTINGGVVREGDLFDFREGTGGFVHHKKDLTNPAGRRIVAAWATAEAQGRPNIVSVIGIDELESVKAKSPGASRSESPWSDIDREIGGKKIVGIGYAAMCEKTAKRRLARSLPLSVMQSAVALENAQDQGHSAFYNEHRELKVVGSGTADDPPPPAEGPVSQGNIVDHQPADLTTPANPPPVRTAWPTFSKMKDFQTYSFQYLKNCTGAQARAFLDNYKDDIERAKKNTDDKVRAFADDLEKDLKDIIAEDGP